MHAQPHRAWVGFASAKLAVGTSTAPTVSFVRSCTPTRSQYSPFAGTSTSSCATAQSFIIDWYAASKPAGEPRLRRLSCFPCDFLGRRQWLQSNGCPANHSASIRLSREIRQLNPATLTISQRFQRMRRTRRLLLRPHLGTPATTPPCEEPARKSVTTLPGPAWFELSAR